MTHFADVETVDLPVAFAESLLVDATCEAVLVESVGSGEPVGTPEGTRVGVKRRGSVVLFRVGQAYVAEIVAGDGPTQTLGLAPADADAYLDLVDRDDGWTVVSVGGALSMGRQKGTETGAVPGR